MTRDIKELLQDYASWKTAFAENGRVDDDTRITVNEAFSTPDAPLIFPRVISDVLKEAAEPELNLTPLLNVVRLGKGRSLEFPAVNALQAFHVPEGQEYPEDALAFARQVEGKVTKKGLKVSITQEAIDDSQWDLIGLHLRAAGRAMARLKEGIVATRLKESGTVVFDNDDGAVDDTTGLGNAGTANLSITMDDVIKMGAILQANHHVPTDVIMHPFSWAVFYGTPELRAQLVPGGSISGQPTAPFGLNVIVSPFVGFTAAQGATPAKADLFVIDRRELGVNLVKDDLSTEEFNDPRRDIRSLKVRERYDIVVLGAGEGITVAKGVRLLRAYDVQLTKAVV